jgi:methionine-rich copper-binding protein CopC
MAVATMLGEWRLSIGHFMALFYRRRPNSVKSPRCNRFRPTSIGQGLGLTIGATVMTPPRVILYILALASSLLGFGLGVKTAFAHAIVVAATPSAHQTVAQAELNVEIRFNSRVDVGRSRLTLVRPDGASVILPLLGSGASETLTAKAPGLENGNYRLLWQTLSIDGHITHGEIPFEVKR